MKTDRLRLGIAARRYRGRQFGEQTSYLRGLIRIAHRKGLSAYVFEPGGIDLATRSVVGWTLRAGRWKKGRFPLPDVVHDRAWRLGPKTERAFREAIAEMTGNGIPVFNPHFGDKLDMHRVLSCCEGAADHLPETRPLTPESLHELAGRYPTVYAKPRAGRQGKGIAVCRRRGEVWRIARQAPSGRVKSSTASSAEEAVGLIARDRPADEYLVQQGLDLVKVNGGSVDIRVIVQRNHRGAWMVTGKGVRVGPRGGLVSNLHAGGRAASLASLPSGSLKRKRRLSEEIGRLAVAVAGGISAAFPTAGEIGLDLGLDRDGHLWVLEVNRQPGRALFSRAGLLRSWRRSRLRVVQFAGYLARKARAGSI